MNDLDQLTKILQERRALSFDEASKLQGLILNGSVDTANLVKIFELIEAKGPILEQELKGFFKASQEAMLNLNLDFDTLDTCGTGGGGENTFNISTAAAIVCSAADVPVAKHGNRAATSLCGSADVLEALKIKIDLKPDEVAAKIKNHNFVFMFARSFHPAFKLAGEARKQYGKRTFFNLLGPLLNPARATFRLHGFANPDYIEILGKILIESGVKKAWLVHSRDHLDEISPFAITDVYEFTQGQEVKHFTIDPEDYGFNKGELKDIRGGDSKINAQIIVDVFENKGNEAQKAAVVLNAGAALRVFGQVNDLQQGIKLAEETIISGKALKKLVELQS